MSAKRSGVLAVFDSLDSTVEAIERLQEAGVKRFTVFSPAPDHNLEHAIHAPASPVRLFTLVGGLTGTATGFALPTWTSLDWPLVTGGKPIISMPAWVIIAFELTILFGALSTVVGMLITARLPQRSADLVYDPSFSADRYGVYVPDAHGADARRILDEAGAVELRESAGEVPVATA